MGLRMPLHGHKKPAQPADGAPERQRLLEAADLLAKVLDTTVKIPGTSLYLGLDPLLGLIPGIGDALANLIGTIILGLATRLGVPRIVVARMSLNLLINGTVGAVPIAGDLFSVWFRSHARNAVLLRQAALETERGTRWDWLYVIGLVGGTVLVLLLAIASVVWLVVALWAAVAQL
jgi:hypothetical protein